ncbi:hypothetical protein K466DRAFT_607372 [Polyporus arcularius HHB13444]|uniref:Uncharacterized protein n=1 Tax=Polyporus arcularius HHB13444 TaxID=1314778 RepID=A0A5C3NQ17_9APHY|nr:hypothetical protein K466DRAFT_607372 [Polyporus arcularius HHB13444]
MTGNPTHLLFDLNVAPLSAYRDVLGPLGLTKCTLKFAGDSIESNLAAPRQTVSSNAPDVSRKQLMSTRRLGPARCLI